MNCQRIPRRQLHRHLLELIRSTLKVIRKMPPRRIGSRDQVIPLFRTPLAFRLRRRQRQRYIPADRPHRTVGYQHVPMQVMTPRPVVPRIKQQLPIRPRRRQPKIPRSMKINRPHRGYVPPRKHNLRRQRRPKLMRPGRRHRLRPHFHPPQIMRSLPRTPRHRREQPKHTRSNPPPARRQASSIPPYIFILHVIVAPTINPRPWGPE
jgi:hypothetical protein